MVLLTRLAKQVYRRSSEEQLGMQLRHLVALTSCATTMRAPSRSWPTRFCMDANNVVLLLNELEQLGYATRLRDPLDRRRHVVQLTDAGRARAGAGRARTGDRRGRRAARARRRTSAGFSGELLTRALRGVEPADGPPVPSARRGAA